MPATMKLAICNEIFEGWELSHVFRFAGQLGYDAVEIAPFTLADSVEELNASQRREIRKAAEESGVEIAGLHWLFVKPPGLHLTSPDRKIRERTRDYLDALIRFCGDLGGKVLIVGSPNQRNIAPGVLYEDAFRWAVETFQHAAQTAQEANAILCIEPLTSRSTNFIRTPTEAMKLVEAVNHPNFQMMLDVYSSSLEKLDIPAEIRRYRHAIRHIHTNDTTAGYPGTGTADYPSIIAALKEIGYQGYLSVEVFDFEPGPDRIARESIQFLKALL